MQTVSGNGNWKLTIKRYSDCIHILRAVTCDEKAYLPDTIFDLPVTVLADRALAWGARPVEGEEVTVTCGIEREEWSNRNIRELTLPRFLETMDNYALYNCKSIQTLHFYDDIRNIGSDVFMNCRALKHASVTRTGSEQGPMLAHMAHSFQKEMDVTVINTDGSECRFVLPEYWEIFEENKAAHQFEFCINGAGYPYHNDVFRINSLDMKDYDGLWEHFLETEHEDDTALKIAWRRIRFPYGLSRKAEEAYCAYVRENIKSAFRTAVSDNDTAGIKLLLEYPESTGEAMTYARELAREMRKTQVMALLLEKKGTDKRGLDRDFDL